MVNPWSATFGPLVGSECRRAQARGWLILARTLAALAVMAATLITLWWWWISSLSNPSHQPYWELRYGLGVVEGMLVTVGLVLAPAVLAGSLAGEKERGALGLLLTTRVTPREIVVGRLAGKLTQVLMIQLAGLPALVVLAALAGMNADVMACLLALPVVVAFGAGGLATAVSAIARRGRDALMTVYLVEILVLMVPIAGALGLPPGPSAWVALVSPFTCLDRLVSAEQLPEALLTMGLWGAIGLAGTGVARWRLVPALLAQIDGGRLGRRGGRRGRVPPLDEARPMMWKELWIERAGTLGGFGFWLGAVLSLLLAAGSVGLLAAIAWATSTGGDPSWARRMMTAAIAGSAPIVMCLIEWAIGLRAAVAIASERERGTWDAILTSPLEGKEILRAKLWGALSALRWLLASALLAWTIAAASNAMPPLTYVDYLVGTLLAGAFMAAVGVRASLSCATATRAMAVTIGIWLGAQVVASLVSLLLMGLAAGVIVAVTSLLVSPGMPFALPPWFATTVATVGLVSKNLPYLIATVILVGYTRLLFDRLAGRRSGGQAAVSAERFLHGTPGRSPHDPVALAEGKPAPQVADAFDAG